MTSLEVENARLRAELEAVIKQRNSAQRKAKFYFRKWKRQSQIQDAAPSAIALVQKHVEAELDGYRRSVRAAFTQEDVDCSLSQVSALESILTVIPKCIQLAATAPKPPKPPKRPDPATAMQEWLEGQADSYRRSLGDVGWFTDSDDWHPRMEAKREAFQDALYELKRLRKV